jgi:hypothetical protein
MPTGVCSALLLACTSLLLGGVAGCASTPSQQQRPVAAAPRLPKPDPSIEVVTREQLEHTGQTNLGAALRQVVPALQ